MKIIRKIAANELRYLFYSPVAWFIIIVFLIQCAVFYTNPVYSVANWQDILLKNNPKYKGTGFLTSGIFTEGRIFKNVISNLFLYIPLLTMGLISRENNNGSTRLLYSSPVTLRQIVLGKYLGITLYNLLLIAVPGIFVVTGCVIIKNVDYGMLLSALTGFYLLVCAYSAIGLFMSSLSNYQIVSALSTFTAIFVLSHIGGLWQRYDLVRDLTWFLSLQDRTGKMLDGLIVTRDLVYFIIVAAMFVCFTWIKLMAGRGKKPWYNIMGRYIAVIAAALVIGYISSRPTLTAYFDLTATRSNTIPKEMQELLRETEGSTLEATLYTNLLGTGLSHGLPEARNADYMSALWDPYLRFRPDMKFSYEYYYDTDAQGTDSAIYRFSPGKTLEQIVAQNADMIDASPSMFQTPEQMHRKIDLKPEGYNLVIGLRYRGRTEFLRTFNDNYFWPDLNNVSAGVKRLLHPDRIPKIYYVTGELERSIIKTGHREYSAHSSDKTGRGALVNTGYDVDTINLANQELPAGITLLVLADPKMDLLPTVQNKLLKYINEGGNLLITGEPGKQYIISQLLRQLGIQMMNGQLVEPTWDETPDKVIPYGTAFCGNLFEGLSWVAPSLAAGGDTLKVLMPGVTALRDTTPLPGSHVFPVSSWQSPRPFTATPLLLTVPGRTWLKAGELINDSTLPPFNPAAGDLKKNSFCTAVQLTRKTPNAQKTGFKEQRIIVCSDADFASNERLGTGAGFLMPIFSWMDDNDFPAVMHRIPPGDTMLRIGPAGANAQKIIFIWVVPGLVLLTGIILLIRRKRK